MLNLNLCFSVAVLFLFLCFLSYCNVIEALSSESDDSIAGKAGKSSFSDTIFSFKFDSIKDVASTVSDHLNALAKARQPFKDNYVWNMWSTFFKLAEIYVIPLALSLLLFLLTFTVNTFLWNSLNLKFIYILRFNAAVFFMYAIFGPQFVIEYFLKFLSLIYYVLCTVIISECRILFAVSFLVLAFHEYIPIQIIFKWIPTNMLTKTLRSIMAHIPKQLTDQILPAWRVVQSSLRSKREQRLLNIEENQMKMMEILSEALKKKKFF